MLSSIALALLLAHPPAVGPDWDEAAASFRATLAELVAADTSNPPGNEQRAVEIGKKRLASAGVPFDVFTFAPGRQNLVARLKGDGSSPPLLLLAHLDVVGTDGQAWSVPPHQLTEKDGFFYGRGVRDDLGMAVVELEVFLKLWRDRTPLKRDVILAWTGDEESGGDGIRWMFDHAKDKVWAGVAINEGGGPILDEAGEVKLANLQVAEKIYQDFTLTARGSTGHSSVPLEDNAIYRLSKALSHLGSFKFPVELLPVTRAYFKERSRVERPPLSEAMRKVAASSGHSSQALSVLEADPILSSKLRTTCVATTLKGGTRANALPAEASANVNCRILPNRTAGEVRARLAQVIDDPKIDLVPNASFGEGGASPVDGEGPAAIRKVMEELYPGAPLVPSMSVGASDSRFFRAAGIPAYGFDPMPETEADGRKAHGIDERMAIASIKPGLLMLHRLVMALAGK